MVICQEMPESSETRDSCYTARFVLFRFIGKHKQDTSVDFVLDWK